MFCNGAVLQLHMLILDLRVTLRLHPRGLELSIFAMRIWQYIDCLHLLCFKLHEIAIDTC
jgi:hypothetical protein